MKIGSQQYEFHGRPDVQPGRIRMWSIVRKRHDRPDVEIVRYHYESEIWPSSQSLSRVVDFPVVTAILIEHRADGVHQAGVMYPVKR